jgi:hypothetical protein
MIQCLIQERILLLVPKARNHLNDSFHPLVERSTESTAGETTHLVHPGAHMDPEYTLVAHIMVQYPESWHEGIQERGEDAVSNSLSCISVTP